MQNQETPYTLSYLNGGYVGIPGKWIKCYIFMVTALPNRPLLFSCHLENGAIYSRLPIDAFSPKPTDTMASVCEVSNCQLWGNLGNDIEVIKPTYLKDYEVKSKERIGRYLFSIDYLNGMFSEDPEQHKILHLIEFDTCYNLLPNNELLFIDKHFTESIYYEIKRTNNYWTTKS